MELGDKYRTEWHGRSTKALKNRDVQSVLLASMGKGMEMIRKHDTLREMQLS